MKILFVCVYNVGRSQIAEAFFNRLSKKHQAVSAGLETDEYEGRPIFEIAESVVRCMAELGYDVSRNIPKQITPKMVQEVDKVVVIVEKERLEKLPDYLKNSSKLIVWEVKDAKGKSYEFLCKIRNQIKLLVEKLAKDLD